MATGDPSPNEWIVLFKTENEVIKSCYDKYQMDMSGWYMKNKKPTLFPITGGYGYLGREVKKHGGKREGSGRPKLKKSEKKEATKVMRIPLSKVKAVQKLIYK